MPSVSPEAAAAMRAAAKPARQPASAPPPAATAAQDRAAAKASKAAAAEHSAKARRRVQQEAARATRARARALPRWVVALAKVGRWCTPVLLLAGGIGMAMQSGWIGQQLGLAGQALLDISGRAGLRIATIRYEGLAQTSEADVHGYLRVREQDPILALDPADAQKRLQELPWVQSAVVERQLPDRITVRLVERRPMARWQENGVLHLVDEDGTVLSQQIPERFRKLPLLIGDGAPAQARDFLARLKTRPALLERVHAVTLIQGRRWRLRLDTGADVELPEKDVDSALARLVADQETSGLWDRGVKTIDLRVMGKPAVELTPEAQQQLQEREQSTAKGRDRRI